VFDRATPTFQPRLKAGSSGLQQLELDRPSYLLLDDGSPCTHPTATDQITDPNPDNVTPSQLAVDREIEHGAVAKSHREAGRFPAEQGVDANL
jgi:hypothetical protein